MRLLPWKRRPPGGSHSTPAEKELAKLTAKADLITEELDIVVKQMSDLLRRKHTK